ncbi:MAG TPA: FadR family transcriptional regulator [Candidatus Blautia pullicola]|uniref:FadR family transcriptional regulator n=1 Tax=Candidatus Blautia pullicola TaxID=2838498 RepID=A0A9D2JSW3_9FIRM|nr:FadR family transcriptional regulator [Candidatus Blautia pullicola]
MKEKTGRPEPAGENQKVYFVVIEYIKELVKEGKVEFGGRLPSERELMATLGMSRNSIREALRTLENMGLIESRQGQGNFLVNHMGKSLSSVFSMLLFTRESDYIEISQLRRFIEIGAFLLAARNASEQDKEILRDILEQIDAASGQERVALDKQFHDELIRISGNHLLSILNEALSGMFETVIYDLALNIAPQDWDRLNDCHKRVYQCLLDSDVQGGMKSIRDHYNIIDQDIERWKDGKADKT